MTRDRWLDRRWYADQWLKHKGDIRANLGQVPVMIIRAARAATQEIGIKRASKLR